MLSSEQCTTVSIGLLVIILLILLFKGQEGFATPKTKTVVKKSATSKKAASPSPSVKIPVGLAATGQAPGEDRALTGVYGN